uniref:Serine protease F56F10.1 n=1 Tax=Diabrotica virgifera virgifera TaxID=50390 RepID=A0A6P7FYK4_DIAVI
TPCIKILFFRDLSTENLVYLTSQQALADIAFFIEAMNEQHNLTDNVKWIVFGGSYPGNLAAWVRQKYPHLVHGAVSSSAPLLAKLNFLEYYNVVVDSLRASNDNCPTIIKESFSQVEALLLTDDGQRNLNKLFNLCGDITENVNNSLDMSTFFLRLSSQFAEAAQYNENNSLDTLCNIMLNESIGPEINRLAAVYNSTYIENYCFNYNYDTMIEGPRNISWSSHDRSSRAWTYQTCTEFGYFQTTSKFPLSYWIQICQDIFSPSYTETFLNHAIKNTNVEYGGLDIQVSNVVFVHGSLDPWHALGITTTLNEKVPAILINGTAHCGDMRNPSDDDSPQLKAARVKVEELIGTWIDL